PYYRPALLGLGRLYVVRGHAELSARREEEGQRHLDRADKYFRDAIDSARRNKNGPGASWEGYYGRGRVRMLQREYAQAVQDLVQARKRHQPPDGHAPT